MQAIKKSGIMLSEVAFSNFPVLFKAAGLDFFILDCEHGGFDYAETARIIMTARLSALPVIVRLANGERKDIVKYMDMGADGLLLPMTNDAEEIAAVVRYAKYAPEGKRGVSTMRAHTMYAPPPVNEYVVQANARTRVFAQIETAAGVEHVKEILSVKGVDGCFVGPNDLSADLGCLGAAGAPPVLAAIERVGEAARACKKRAGVITTDEAYLSRAKECGYELFSKGSELNAVKEYCRAIVSSIEQ